VRGQGFDETMRCFSDQTSFVKYQVEGRDALEGFEQDQYANDGRGTGQNCFTRSGLPSVAVP
jgi:hypothetical protein